MQVTTLFGWIVVASALGQTNAQNAIDEQDKVFQDWWGIRLERKFNELPMAGSVPEFRTPYSGCIYLDSAGGTVRALRKYDQAFNGGRNSATRHEQWDTTAFRKTEYVQRTYRYGLFGGRVGRRTVAVTRIPHWHGHCNGWTSAAIRYAEPQKTVVRNGVSFSPADIKGLLAEIYMYQDEDILAGESSLVSPGRSTFWSPTGWAVLPIPWPWKPVRAGRNGTTPSTSSAAPPCRVVATGSQSGRG